MSIDVRVNNYKLDTRPKFPRLRKERVGAHFADPQALPSNFEVPGTRLATIINAACRVCDISRDHLLGPRRSRVYSRPRQMVMHIAREKCPHLSLPSIGRLLGGRDHTTIMHGVRKCQVLLDNDPDFRGTYNRIMREAGFC